MLPIRWGLIFISISVLFGDSIILNGRKYVLTRGLPNLSNTCCLNSVLQCIVHTKPFRAVFSNNLGASTLESGGFKAALGQLSLDMILDASAESGELKDINMQVRENLGDIIKHLDMDERIQEDAHEILLRILNKLDNESKSTDIIDIFKGMLIVSTCDEQSCRGMKEEPFIDVSLEVRGKEKDLLEVLNKRLNGVETIEIPSSGPGKQNPAIISRKFSVLKWPRALLVHLKRFDYDLQSYSVVKISDEFIFPERFHVKDGTLVYPKDVGSFLFPAYELTAIILHVGTPLNGHYVCVTRTAENSWTLYDDANSFDVAWEDIERFCFGSSRGGVTDSVPTAYLLIYSQIEA